MALLAASANLSSASAATTTDGTLYLGGVGGGWTLDALTGRSGALGSTVSFPVRVYNYEFSQTQFNVRVGTDQWGTKVQVLSGSGADVTTVATDGTGYYTTPISAGQSETLTVKVTIPSTVAQLSGDPTVSALAVNLYSTDGTYITGRSLYTSIAPSTAFPTSAYDLSVTAKSSTSVTAKNQSSVGSPNLGLMSAPLINATSGSQSFTATVTNHSSSTVTEYIKPDYVTATYGFSQPTCDNNPPTSSISFKASALAAAQGEIYISLGAGKSVSYTVTVKVSSWGGCAGLYYILTPMRWDSSAGWVDANPSVYLDTSANAG